jgi:hypothetical protein
MLDDIYAKLKKNTLNDIYQESHWDGLPVFNSRAWQTMPTTSSSTF